MTTTEYILQITKTQSSDFLKRFSHSKKSFHVEFHAGKHVVQCNRIVLDWWSSSYNDKVLGGNILRMDRFRERIKVLQDCVDLIHGRKVKISVDDIELFDHFANFLNIRELIEAVDGMRAANGLGKPRTEIIERRSGTLDRNVPLRRSQSAMSPRPHSAIILPKSTTAAYLQAGDVDYITDLKSDSASSLGGAGGSGYKAERRQSLSQRLSKVFKPAKHYVKGSLISVSQTPDTVLPDPLRRNQLWKMYSFNEMLQLRENPQILEFMFVEVFLAWVAFHKPTISVVNMLYETIVEEDLNLTYISCILSHLDDMYGYRVTKRRKYTGESKYVCLSWDIPSQEEREIFLSSNSLKLRASCTFENCSRGKVGSETVTKIQLNNVSGFCSVKMMKVDLSPTDHQHSTWRYQNWFLFGLSKENICEVCSLYTSSHAEIRQFVEGKHTIMLRCLYDASQRHSLGRHDSSNVSNLPG